MVRMETRLRVLTMGIGAMLIVGACVPRRTCHHGARSDHGARDGCAERDP
jgi:hypothetical protein